MIELLQGHAERSATAAAYLHAEHAPERKRAMQFLADRIERIAAGAAVVPFKAA